VVTYEDYSNPKPHPEPLLVANRKLGIKPQEDPSVPEPAEPTVVPRAPAAEDDDSITWTASEFIAHTKSTSWYLLLSVAAIVVAAIIFLITRDKITTVVVLVAALALGVYGARKPRELAYGLHPGGVSIADKFYGYENFRSFAVVDEGGLSSIVFVPMKRFGQLLTIYFDPNDEPAITDMLADRLPLEVREHDMLDRFMKRIRF